MELDILVPGKLRIEKELSSKVLIPYLKGLILCLEMPLIP
jgi:hypothetical protein